MALRGLAFSPDGTILAAVLGGNGRFYDASSGEQIGTTLPLHTFSGNLAWSAVGSVISDQ